MRREYGRCIMCDKKIRDGGNLFCPRCRKKDILLRIKVFKDKGMHKRDLSRFNKPNEKRFYSETMQRITGEL